MHDSIDKCPLCLSKDSVNDLKSNLYKEFTKRYYIEILKKILNSYFTKVQFKTNELQSKFKYGAENLINSIIKNNDIIENYDSFNNFLEENNIYLKLFSYNFERMIELCYK